MKAFEIFSPLSINADRTNSVLHSDPLPEQCNIIHIHQAGFPLGQREKGIWGVFRKMPLLLLSLLTKLIHSIYLCSNLSCLWAHCNGSVFMILHVYPVPAGPHHSLDMWRVPWWFRQSFLPQNKTLQLEDCHFQQHFSKLQIQHWYFDQPN